MAYYKYAPSDSILNTYSNYNGTIVPATLSFSKFNAIDLSMGLDYNPFKKLPELYFGPELFQKILPILKEKSYSEVKEKIILLKYF